MMESEHPDHVKEPQTRAWRLWSRDTKTLNETETVPCDAHNVRDQTPNIHVILKSSDMRMSPNCLLSAYSVPYDTELTSLSPRKPANRAASLCPRAANNVAIESASCQAHSYLRSKSEATIHDADESSGMTEHCVRKVSRCPIKRDPTAAHRVEG